MWRFPQVPGIATRLKLRRRKANLHPAANLFILFRGSLTIHFFCACLDAGRGGVAVAVVVGICRTSLWFVVCVVVVVVVLVGDYVQLLLSLNHQH